LIDDAIYYAHENDFVEETGINFKCPACSSTFKSVYIFGTPDHSNYCIMRRTLCMLRVDLPKKQAEETQIKSNRLFKVSARKSRRKRMLEREGI